MGNLLIYEFSVGSNNSAFWDASAHKIEKYFISELSVCNII
jgi:hypothetical protein